MDWLYRNVGLDLMHNNPLIYRMNIARIRFCQNMKFQNPPAAEGWVMFYPRWGPDSVDEGPPGMVTVDFEGLVYGRENIP